MKHINESKLVATILKKLNKEDLPKISRFLKSPYLNSNKKVAQLFDLLRKEYPDFNNKNLTEEKLYKKLYPDRAFNEGVFRGLRTKLVKKIEAYFVLEELNQDENLQEELMGRAYANRGNYNQFLGKSKLAIQRISEKENKDILDYRSLLKINHDLFFHSETVRDKSLRNNCLDACMGYLDCFYFFSKVTYGLIVLNRNNLRKKQQEILLLSEAIQLGQQTPLNTNKLYNLYALANNIMLSPDQSAFRALKDFLFENPDEIYREGKITTISLLVNFLFSEERKNKGTSQEQLFELYKFGVQHKLFMNNDIIPNNIFLNVIVTSAACGEFEWTKDFKKRYIPFLKTDTREEVENLAEAYLHFYKKHYEKAIEILVCIGSRDANISLRSRSLSIRSYYEAGADFYDIAERATTNFESFLRRQEELSDERKSAYLNFCKICMGLLYAKSKKSLLGKMEKMEFLIYRGWLTIKVNALR